LLAGTGHVDENVFGIVPLEIYLHNSDPDCLADGVALADHQQRNIDAQIRDAVDDMFMITGLQVQAYRATGEAEYLTFMAPIMVQYLGAQLTDGLFNQLASNSAKWSRGNGWFASGMTEILRELDHEDYPEIRQGYERMMDGLRSHQIQSGDGAGLWRQVIDYSGTDCFAETSDSAMFTNAMVTGIKNGWLDCETYGPVARSAWIGLVAYLQPDGRLTNISD
jgi:rhamnogalacturonyl hydrolase YesR